MNCCFEHSCKDASRNAWPRISLRFCFNTYRKIFRRYPKHFKDNTIVAFHARQGPPSIKDLLFITGILERKEFIQIYCKELKSCFQKFYVKNVQKSKYFVKQNMIGKSRLTPLSNRFFTPWRSQQLSRKWMKKNKLFTNAIYGQPLDRTKTTVNHYTTGKSSKHGFGSKIHLKRIVLLL